MKKIIFYVVFLATFFSCKKENKVINTIITTQDSINLIINNPTFRTISGKLKSIGGNLNSVMPIDSILYYNDGRIAKVVFNYIIDVSYNNVALIFIYQTNGYDVNWYEKSIFDSNYHLQKVFHLKTNNANKIISKSSEYSGIVNETKYTYIGNQINTEKSFHGNELLNPYFNKFVYNTDGNLIFQCVNNYQRNDTFDVGILDSFYYTYTTQEDDLGVDFCTGSFYNFSQDLVPIPQKLTGYSLQNTTKLFQNKSYKYFFPQTNITYYYNELYNYEYNSSNRISKIKINTDEADENHVLIPNTNYEFTFILSYY